jgi:mono/diheme cytochrome c family protein
MNSGKLLIATAIGLCLALPTLASADGAATYKAKCAACHGAEAKARWVPH